MKLKSNLRKIRVDTVLDKIVQETGVSYPTVQRLDSSDNIEGMKLGTVKKIANFFNVGLDDLIIDEDREGLEKVLRENLKAYKEGKLTEDDLINILKTNLK